MSNNPSPIQLLQGGQALFASMVQDFAQATHSIWLETYIFDLTGQAAQVAAALTAAAKRGVQVRVLVDGFGTPQVPQDWLDGFTQAGGQWRVYSRLGPLGLLLPHRWRRLHRKLCLVDGKLLYCGGINILDDFHDPNHGALKAPRFDFAVRTLDAPVVMAAQTTMRQLWVHTDEFKPANWRDLSSLSLTVNPDSKLKYNSTQLIIRDNIRYRRAIERSYLKAIGQARREVLIANAYFLPGVRLQNALVRAAKRGVAVRLLLQGRYEYFMQYHAAKPIYGRLLKAGVRIHEYDSSFLHAKVAVVDGDNPTEQRNNTAWATVGSSNLDPLSLLLAREANLVTHQTPFAHQLRQALTQAMTTQGREISPEQYAARGIWQRGLNWLAYGLMRFALLLVRRRY